MISRAQGTEAMDTAIGMIALAAERRTGDLVDLFNATDRADRGLVLQALAVLGAAASRNWCHALGVDDEQVPTVIRGGLFRQGTT